MDFLYLHAVVDIVIVDGGVFFVLLSGLISRYRGNRRSRKIR